MSTIAIPFVGQFLSVAITPKTYDTTTLFETTDF